MRFFHYLIFFFALLVFQLAQPAKAEEPRFNAESLCDFAVSVMSMGQTYTAKAINDLAVDMAHLLLARKALAEPALSEQNLERIATYHYGKLGMFQTVAEPCHELNIHQETEETFRRLGGVLHGLSAQQVHELSARTIKRLEEQVLRRQNDPVLRYYDVTCLPDDLPKKARVYSLLAPGVHAQLAEYHFPNVIHETNVVDVFIKPHEMPIVLMLNGHKPTVWNIHAEEGADLALIVSTNSFSTAVANAPEDVPVELWTKFHGVRDACKEDHERFRTAYLSNYALGKLPDKKLYEWENTPLKELPLLRERFHAQFVLSPGEPHIPDTPLASQPINYESVIKVGSLTPREGVPVLEKVAFYTLRGEGRMRLATQDDIDRWLAKARAPYLHLTDEYLSEHLLEAGNVFVPLGPVDISQAFGVGNGALGFRFIIPEGVPMPTIHRSASSFHFMKDGKRR